MVGIGQRLLEIRLLCGLLMTASRSIIASGKLRLLDLTGLMQLHQGILKRRNGKIECHDLGEKSMKSQDKIAHGMAILSWIALCLEPYVLGMVFPKCFVLIFIGFAFFHILIYKKLTTWEKNL